MNKYSLSEKAAIAQSLWDSAECREGHYALLLAITQSLRPEQAFAALHNMPMPEVTAEDCEDIRRMRKRSLCYDGQDRELIDGAGLGWQKLSEVYCCGERDLKQAYERGRCKMHYTLKKG